MTWTVSGHTFLTERYAGDANRKNSIHIGIAERYDLVVPKAGGPRMQAGDYIHFNGRSSKFSEGAWGIIRVYDKEQPDLKKLPAGYSHRNEIPAAQPICPADAPVKTFNVVAMDHPSMKFNPKAPEAIEVDFERKIQITNPDAKIYAATVSGTLRLPVTPSRSTALYVLGGGGLYNFRNFGPGSAMSGYFGNDIQDPFAKSNTAAFTKFGYNVGAGLELGIGTSALMIESRLVSVSADRGTNPSFDKLFGNRGNEIRWVPVTVGIVVR